MTTLKEQLTYEEGRRLITYLCSRHHRTIGIGHNLDVKPYFRGVKIPNVITDTFCDDLFNDDVKDITAALEALYPNLHNLDAARRDALINMAFQLGALGVSKFKKMLDALDDKDWEKAYTEALNSNWAVQTPNRAKRVASQLLTGEYYHVEKNSI